MSPVDFKAKSLNDGSKSKSESDIISFVMLLAHTMSFIAALSITGGNMGHMC